MFYPFQIRTIVMQNIENIIHKYVTLKSMKALFENMQGGGGNFSRYENKNYQSY